MAEQCVEGAKKHAFGVPQNTYPVERRKTSIDSGKKKTKKNNADGQNRQNMVSTMSTARLFRPFRRSSPRFEAGKPATNVSHHRSTRVSEFVQATQPNNPRQYQPARLDGHSQPTPWNDYRRRQPAHLGGPPNNARHRLRARHDHSSRSSNDTWQRQSN